MLVNGFIGTRYGDRKGETYLAALQILGSSRWPAEGAMVMVQRWNSSQKMVEKRERMPDDAGVHGVYTLISPPQTRRSAVAVRRHPRDQNYMFFLFALYVLFDSMMTSEWIQKRFTTHY